jgi:hypothetical protein
VTLPIGPHYVGKLAVHLSQSLQYVFTFTRLPLCHIDLHQTPAVSFSTDRPSHLCLLQAAIDDPQSYHASIMTSTAARKLLSICPPTNQEGCKIDLPPPSFTPKNFSAHPAVAVPLVFHILSYTDQQSMQFVPAGRVRAPQYVETMLQVGQHSTGSVVENNTVYGITVH